MNDNSDVARVQADFDRLALLLQEGWNHNSHYHRFILKQVPPYSRNALEIGCGTGAFARLLARRVEHVLALDLSPQMIRLAQERSASYANIDFQLADVLSLEFPHEEFDCIVSIATIHHVPMEDILSKMKTALAVNGTIIVLDLYRARPSDIFTILTAIPINILLKYLKTGRSKEPPEVQEAWAEHGQYDSYLTLAQLRHICRTVLPGAKVRRHLLWRYSLVWKKTSK